MSKTKELIICIISIIALILAIATNVFASDVDSLDELLANTNSNENENFATIEDNTTNNTNITSNVANNTSTMTTSNNTANRTNNTSNTTTIPYTGVDYSLLVIIAICGVSAIYAYKKIRDYNI